MRERGESADDKGRETERRDKCEKEERVQAIQGDRALFSRSRQKYYNIEWCASTPLVKTVILSPLPLPLSPFPLSHSHTLSHRYRAMGVSARFDAIVGPRNEEEMYSDVLQPRMNRVLKEHWHQLGGLILAPISISLHCLDGAKTLSFSLTLSLLIHPPVPER